MPTSGMTTDMARWSAVVIGAGASGCFTALSLAASGLQVVLLERSERILEGATARCGARLHRGYHYPNSTRTAAECAEACARFASEYREAILPAIRSAYFFPKETAREAVESYRSFCNAAHLPLEEIDPQTFVPEVRGCSFGAIVEEDVFDVRVLRQRLLGRLASAGVQLVFGANAARVVRSRYGLEVRLRRGDSVAAAVVVNATYTGVNDIGSELDHEPIPMEFVRYLIRIIECPLPPHSVTLLGAKFLALLPEGRNSTFRFFDDTATQVGRALTLRVPDDWRWTSAVSKALNERSRRALQLAEHWIPALSEARTVELVWNVRAKPTTPTERDTWSVHENGDGYITVFASKVASALVLAEHTTKIVRRYLEGA